MLKQNQASRPIKAAKRQAPSNVINLMDALRESLGGKTTAERPAAKKSVPKTKQSKAKKVPAKRKAS